LYCNVTANTDTELYKKEIKQATPTKLRPGKKEMQDLRILGEKVEMDSLPLATKNLKDCKGKIYVPFVEQFLSFVKKNNKFM